MRTARHSASPPGSVTLVALCFTAVLGIALASYLSLYQGAYNLGTRELHQNKARQLAQTGLEEALWALNQNTWSGSGPSGTTAWATAGFNRTVTLSYGSLGQGATGTVMLTVVNFASTGPIWPTIISAATISLGDGRVFTKTMQATTGPAPLFGNAIASAKSYVRFDSGGTVDSWNSDPDNNPATPVVAYAFTAGTTANYDAVIAATDTNNNFDGTNAVIINQAQVYGYLATAGKNVAYSSSGTPPGRVIGPIASGVNMTPARIGKSASIPASSVFTVTAPPLVSGSYTLLTLLTAILTISPADQAIYSAPTGLSLPSGLLGYTLNIARPVQMVVNGNFTIGSGLLGAAKIVIQPPNGSLEIFVTGDVAIGGNGIDNQTHDPRKLAVFCTNTSALAADSVRYTTSADFYGVIYSVNAPIDIQQNATFYGALLSDQYVHFSGSATSPIFHYDSSLRNVAFSGVTTPYIITTLTES